MMKRRDQDGGERVTRMASIFACPGSFVIAGLPGAESILAPVVRAGHSWRLYSEASYPRLTLR